MVTLLNKWWLAPVLSLGLFSNGKYTLSADSKQADYLHPIHISTLEIDHNAADKSLEITCKIFWDDFETILTKNNKSAKVDLADGKKLNYNNKLVSAYLNNHLAISLDGKPVTLNFMGFEKEDAVIFSYLEVTNISVVKKISITNTLMQDMFDDQVEIIHVVVNGKRQSTKLDYPAKSAEFVF